MSEEDGLRLLKKYRTNNADDELSAMRDLVIEVGVHTQALMLLGEHARNDPGGYPNALKRLKAAGSVRRIEEIATRLRNLLGAQARGIVATFALSIETLSDSAREIMSLASVCAPNVSISEALLAQVFGHERVDEFIAALGAVVRASLLQRREASVRSLFIHSLVAEAVVSLLNVDAQVVRRRVADGLLERVVNTGDIRAHGPMLEDIEQARNLGWKLKERLGVGLLLRVGNFELVRGQYAVAVVAVTQALQVAREVLGDEHPDSLISMNNLAVTLRLQGDLVAARALQEQVLLVRQRIQGEDHPDTLRSMNNLAITLRAQGDFGAARKLHEDALLTLRPGLGEEHPVTLTTINNLAEVLRAQGEVVEACALHEQALSSRRRLLGEEHPDTSTSAGNLLVTLLEIGDRDSAAKLLRSTLLWLLKRDPLSLGAEQRSLRDYVSQIDRQLST